MNEPIKTGDRCLVIDGTLKHKSPNIGKIVTVKSLQGEHSTLGRIWHCNGVDLIQFDGSTSTSADFPTDWLQKLNPPKLPAKVLTLERVE